MVKLEDIIRKRRSVRKFKNQKVSDKDIRSLLELSSLSPSAGNLQARSVIIVRDKKIKDEIRKACHGFFKFTTEIPVIVVVLANIEESSAKYAQRGRDLYALQDATIFASYFQLLAVSKGLATRWIGSFDENVLTKILNLPSGLRPVTMLPVGYPDENPSEKDLKSLKDIIYKEL